VYPDQFYGTLRSEVEDRAEETPVLLDIDVNGALNVKRIFGDDALVLFIAPPSVDELKRRLEGRGTENLESLQNRIDRAEQELATADACDAVVVNDDLDAAVEETLTRIRRFLTL
jgi:guanylate kinase